jgi:two-component system phosphate regulon response regulator PhoB
MTNASVLIVEDEPEIADLIRYHVQREGARAAIARTGRQALESVERRKPDIVVLDLMLPDLDGLEVCRRLRWQSATRTLPILIVSAKGEESDIVAGLELGADDYVTKPFSPKVLMARIRSLLRRGRPAEPGAEAKGRLAPADGALVIDLDRHEVEVNGRPVKLTPTEFGILRCLAGRPGFVRTREQILGSVHGETTVLSPRAVDVHMTALRRKLGEAAGLIETVRGIGYRLREDQDDQGE